ncbi:MAG: hypothetical protein WAW63_05055 [Candidatus Saccharimonadales bacterium]
MVNLGNIGDERRYPDWNTGEVPDVLKGLGVTSIGSAGKVIQFGDPDSGGRVLRLTGDEQQMVGMDPNTLADFLKQSD